MPVYTYRCPECGEEIERLAKRADEPPSCPNCGKPTFQVWSTPSPAVWKCSKGSL